jgi:hypothetical protein
VRNTERRWANSVVTSTGITRLLPHLGDCGERPRPTHGARGGRGATGRRSAWETAPDRSVGARQDATGAKHGAPAIAAGSTATRSARAAGSPPHGRDATARRSSRAGRPVVVPGARDDGTVAARRFASTPCRGFATAHWPATATRRTPGHPSGNRAAPQQFPVIEPERLRAHRQAPVESMRQRGAPAYVEQGRSMPAEVCWSRAPVVAGSRQQDVSRNEYAGRARG